MKRQRLNLRVGFHVGITTRSAQAATMVLVPGGKEGGASNKHEGADQWLFVIEGTGRATVNGRKLPLAAGTLLLVKRGDTHEIRNTGRGHLKTVNFYVPPAYGQDGEPLSRGRPA